MIDLADIAKSLLADAIDTCTDARGEGIDLRKLREEISDRSLDAADSACTYTHHCADIIRDYESDPRADTDSADDMGSSFKPSQYREAMTAYAFGIARPVIEAEAFALVDELEEAHVDIFVALNSLNDRALDVVTESDIRLSASCPHGWAAHNREDDAGACYWLSGQLDGCNAVAVPAAGVWLSYTWEPLRRAAEPAVAKISLNTP